MNLITETESKETKNHSDFQKIYEIILEIWNELIPDHLLAESIMKNQMKKLNFDINECSRKSIEELVSSLETSAASFKTPAEIKNAFRKVHSMINELTISHQEEISIFEEVDILTARLTGAKLASELGFGKNDGLKISTIITELAKNIILYAKPGKILIKPILGVKRGLEITAMDNGPGIENVNDILEKDNDSKRGLVEGLKGVRSLADYFIIDSKIGHGTTVTVIKYLN